MKKLLFIFFVLSIMTCNQSLKKRQTPNTNTSDFSEDKPVKKKPKNIILMIGDGMGLGQISAGLYQNGNKLNLERFSVIGLHKSHAHDDLITDSAAGATAFACGIKANNGAIGVYPNEKPAKTILEEAEEKGLATGMVATSTIVHATPASFIAHQKQRKMYEEIAADFLNTEIDYFVGGGKKYFDRREKDDRNLYKELEDKKYFVSDYFKEDFENVKIPKNKNFAFFTSDDDPLPVASGRDYLQLATERALPFLKNHSKKGFFAMIEGSQIDWGGHANDSDYILTEMIEFDNTIGAVLDWVIEDKETLLIVTADHETGGYAIHKGSEIGKVVTAFTTDYHTGTMIPVFAYGPGSQDFSGIYENTAIYDKMKIALGL